MDTYECMRIIPIQIVILIVSIQSFSWLFQHVFVYTIQSTDSSEVALCYYKSPKDTEPRGWVYLRDVIELSDDGKIFSVISPARTMVLEAQTSAEHRFWLFGLADLCPGANTSLIKSQAPSKISLPSLHHFLALRLSIVNAEQQNDCTEKLTNKRVSEEKMQIDRNGRNNDESEERNARHIPNEYHEKRDDQHLKSANQSSNSVNEDADSKQSTRIARNEDSKSFRQYNNQNARNQPENREEQNIAQYNRRSNHNLNDFVSTNTVNKNNKSSENLPDSASYHSMRRINSQSVNERIDDQTMRQSETQDRKTRTTPRRKSPTNSMKQNRDHEDFEDKPTAFQSYETESTPYQERGSTSDEKSRTKAPAGPPPKRAQDLFKEEGQKRKTIDDIISSRRGSTELELSDDEFDKEFKV